MRIHLDLNVKIADQNKVTFLWINLEKVQKIIAFNSKGMWLGLGFNNNIFSSFVKESHRLYSETIKLLTLYIIPQHTFKFVQSRNESNAQLIIYVMNVWWNWWMDWRYQKHEIVTSVQHIKYTSNAVCSLCMELFRIQT